MWLNKTAHSAKTAIIWISLKFNIAAGVTLVVMMVLTTSDVIGRYIFNRPIMGATEYTEYLMLGLGFWGLAWCAINGKHIMVTLLTSRLPQKTQEIVNSFNYFVLMVLSLILGYQSYKEASSIHQLGTTSDVTKIPEFYFYYVIAIGFILLSLAIITLLIESLLKLVKR